MSRYIIQQKKMLQIYNNISIIHQGYQSGMIKQKQDDNQFKKNKALKTTSQQIEKDLQIKHVIGRGTFGTVYFAKLISRNIDVALKSIAKNPKYKNREIQILSILKHPSIVSLLMYYQKYDEVAKKTYSNLIMEFVPTTLFSIIKSVNSKHQKIQYSKVVTWSKKMLEGIAYLQDKNVCHRDIKPSNILIDEVTSEVKICDFGSAKQLKKGQKSICYICSRYYRAPQLILGCTQYSNKIDIWAIGCVIAEMLTLFPLFDGVNSVDQIAKIVRVLGPPTQQDVKAMKIDIQKAQIEKVVGMGLAQKIKKGNIPPQMLDLLQKLLIYNPNKRLSAKEALNHPVFGELI